jgi:copper chaperone CopZ
MKSIILTAAVILFSTVSTHAQIKDANTATVKVYGNCSMCQANIEKAAKKKQISKADWNKDTKMATITYDSKKTNLDAVLKNIALAGYDNQSFLAPDAAYNKLPECCKYDREKKVAVKTTVKDTAMVMGNHSGHQQINAPATQQTNQLQAVFDNYFAVKDALVKTNATNAQTKATALLSALNAVKMETLKTGEHTIWMKVEKDLKMDAQHISESKKIEQQRNYFSILSQNIYSLIKAAKPIATVYYQNCPMYNDGKGANWLSKENAVKNPYYGSMMLTCGKTVETIK